MLKKGIVVSVTVLAMATLSLPAQGANKLNGTFLHFGYNSSDGTLSRAQLSGIFDEMQDLGQKIAVIGQTRGTREEQDCATSSSSFEWVEGFPSKLEWILDEAESRDINVYVGGTLSSKNCALFWSTSNTRLVVSDTSENLGSLASRFEDHPAFAGWYIPDEPGILDPANWSYYKQVTASLKRLTPYKPVLVAPYLTYANSPSPSALALRAYNFARDTGVDVQIWQDAIGASSQAKLWYWSAPGYSSEEFYEALASRLGPNRLWADIEMFNHGEPLFNGSGAYKSSAGARFDQQIWAARSAGQRVSWLHQYHLSEVTGYADSPRGQASYRAHFGIGGTKNVVSANFGNYSWVSPPSSQYPDARKLFDRKTGNPRDPSDATWTGRLGTAKIRIDLGSAKHLDWVGVHTLTFPSWGIRSPVELNIYCGNSVASLARIHATGEVLEPTNLARSSREEFVLGNRTPLNATCRYVELRMPNEYWTFVSEIELIRE